MKVFWACVLAIFAFVFANAFILFLQYLCWNNHETLPKWVNEFENKQTWIYPLATIFSVLWIAATWIAIHMINKSKVKS